MLPFILAWAFVAPSISAYSKNTFPTPGEETTPFGRGMTTFASEPANNVRIWAKKQRFSRQWKKKKYSKIVSSQYR
uniref:Secreted protein n=1 Tax=Rhizophora mucronata TaxID=61149 RepID=A0A2P2PJI8_RHIMU